MRRAQCSERGGAAPPWFHTCGNDCERHSSAIGAGSPAPGLGARLGALTARASREPIVPRVITVATHDDDLRGGPGNDDLQGGEGDDTLRGGPGNDFFAGDSLRGEGAVSGVIPA